MMSGSLFPDPSPVPEPQPQLKLFVAPTQGDESDSAPPGNLSPEMTLPDFWREFFQPVRLSGRSAKTLKEDRATLAKWKAYAGDRPLGDVDRKLLSGFAPWLESEKKLKRVTAVKHLSRLLTFLRAAGPDNDDEEPCADLLERVPRIKLPGTPRRVPDKAFSLAEIGAWLDNCLHARPMRRIRCAPAFCQAIILFDYFCPLRFESLTAACWEHLRRGFDDRPAGWWLLVAPEDDKNDCEQDYYVSSHAMAALEILDRDRVARLKAGEVVTGPIFGLPMTENCLRRHLKRLLPPSAANRRQKRILHGTRAAADTQLRKLGYPIAAKRALGRAVGNDVDMGFYTGLEEYAHAMEKMPMPKFTRWREPQGWLF